jgi:hypothetical protein
LKSVRVYFAAKSKHANLGRQLRSQLAPHNIDIRSSWLDYPDDFETRATKEDWQKLWTLCSDEASRCDICLVILKKAEIARGSLCEWGAAMSHGKRVFVVHPKNVKAPDARWHPLVTEFCSLADAISALKQAAKRKPTANNVVPFKKRGGRMNVPIRPF